MAKTTTAALGKINELEQQIQAIKMELATPVVAMEHNGASLEFIAEQNMQEVIQQCNNIGTIN